MFQNLAVIFHSQVPQASVVEEASVLLKELSLQRSQLESLSSIPKVKTNGHSETGEPVKVILDSDPVKRAQQVAELSLEGALSPELMLSEGGDVTQLLGVIHSALI